MAIVEGTASTGLPEHNVSKWILYPVDGWKDPVCCRLRLFEYVFVTVYQKDFKNQATSVESRVETVEVDTKTI